ncbi:MAG: CAP domain-containing protein [Terriglobia bacterium]
MTAAALKFQAPDPGDCPVNSSRQEMGPCEKRMLEMMNAARSDPVNDAETGGRARPLKWDPRLAKAALAHSQDMAARRYFDHIDVSGQSPVERIYQAGVQWLSLGENIAKGPSVASAEKNFMSEPRFQLNHRANILSPKFNCAGIGIARGPDGLLYITQDFAQEP